MHHVNTSLLMEPVITGDSVFALEQSSWAADAWMHCTDLTSVCCCLIRDLQSVYCIHCLTLAVTLAINIVLQMRASSPHCAAAHCPFASLCRVLRLSQPPQICHRSPVKGFLCYFYGLVSYHIGLINVLSPWWKFFFFFFISWYNLV